MNAIKNVALFLVWVLLHLLAVPVAAVWLLFGSRGRILNVLIGEDQSWNAILDGSPDETISARAWRNHLDLRNRGAWAVRVIDGLFGAGHCKRAHESEMLRRQLPAAYRAEETA